MEKVHFIVFHNISSSQHIFLLELFEEICDVVLCEATERLERNEMKKKK